MLPPTMSTSTLPQSMIQATASPCGGLGGTVGPPQNTTAAHSGSPSDPSKQIAYAIWIYMGPVIFLIGLTGNVLILVVMSCRRMRGTSTSDYLIIMAVADLLTIVTGMVPEWLEAMGIFVLQTWNPPMCKIYKFVSYACGDTATWIRVLFTLDRFVAICFPMKKTDCCLAWRAKYYCLAAAVAAVAKNLHVFWTRGAEYTTKTVYEYVDCVPVPTNVTNTTLKTNCGYPTEEYRYFEMYVRPWIVFALVNFVPFCVILVCNVFIVRAMIDMTRMRKQRHLSAKTGDWQLFQTTTMCLCASFTFLVCVTPTMVLLIGKPYWTPNGTTNMAYEIAKSVSNQLIYLNNSVNFFLYCITGKKFRETLGLLLRCRCREVLCKSDASVSRGATVRPGSVTAVVRAVGVVGAAAKSNGRQNSSTNSSARLNSIQSVSFDLQSLGERSITGKLEDDVFVRETSRRASPMEREKGMVLVDAVMTQLAVNGGEVTKRGDRTSIRHRSGSQSSSGVSSSTSNGEPSPAALSPPVDADETGPQRLSGSSGNQNLTDDSPSPKEQCHAEELVLSPNQCNVVEHCDVSANCSAAERHSSAEHCSPNSRFSSAERGPIVENNDLPDYLTSDLNFTEDLSLADDCSLAINQYSNVISPVRTNSSVTQQTNLSASEVRKRYPNSSNLANYKTIPSLSSLSADNCGHLNSLEMTPKDRESEETTSHRNLEGQNNDLEEIKTDNGRSIGIIVESSNNRSDVASDAKCISGEKFKRMIESEEAISENDVILEPQRRYTKDDLLDKLPESIC